MKGSPDTRQTSLLPPEAAAILHLVRENLRLLGELTSRYEVGHRAEPADRRIVRRPADLAGYFAAELADLDQEQLRGVLLDMSCGMHQTDDPLTWPWREFDDANLTAARKRLRSESEL